MHGRSPAPAVLFNMLLRDILVKLLLAIAGL
jgi:hypothetical protein